METSASCEARYAPLLYPTGRVYHISGSWITGKSEVVQLAWKVLNGRVRLAYLACAFIPFITD